MFLSELIIFTYNVYIKVTDFVTSLALQQQTAWI